MKLEDYDAAQSNTFKNACLTIIASTVFFGTWAYCAMQYGFLFGFGLGWLPALIVTFIVGEIIDALK
jgi:hypothetical protein